MWSILWRKLWGAKAMFEAVVVNNKVLIGYSKQLDTVIYSTKLINNSVWSLP